MTASPESVVRPAALLDPPLPDVLPVFAVVFAALPADTVLALPERAAKPIAGGL
jgi:hypothetical protein